MSSPEGSTRLTYTVFIINRENEILNRKLMYDCRCDERLKPKEDESTYTGWFGELEHLKIKTRFIDERFPSVMGECVIVTLWVHSPYSK